MFTGLIQSLGTVRNLTRQGNSAALQIDSDLVNEDLQRGESIAVNGVCLTVTGWADQHFIADVSPETLDCTNLGALRPGAQVNLERALRLSDRLGGHLVSGHVDGVATVQRRFRDQNVIRFEFNLPRQAMRYLVEKGSVAVDGISLTVNTVSDHGFSVAVIPHSLEKTTLQNCREGSRVNIETDLIGRYVERLLTGKAESPQGPGLSVEFLAKNGFM